MDAILVGAPLLCRFCWCNFHPLWNRTLSWQCWCLSFAVPCVAVGTVRALLCWCFSVFGLTLIWFCWLDYSHTATVPLLVWVGSRARRRLPVVNHWFWFLLQLLFAHLQPGWWPHRKTVPHFTLVVWGFQVCIFLFCLVGVSWYPSLYRIVGLG